jgi:hypothetical protein
MAILDNLKDLASGKAKIKVPHKRAHFVHKGEHFFHGSYLAGVSVEGHGFYRYIAMVALLFVLIAAFIESES